MDECHFLVVCGNMYDYLISKYISQQFHENPTLNKLPSFCQLFMTVVQVVCQCSDTVYFYLHKDVTPMSAYLNVLALNLDETHVSCILLITSLAHFTAQIFSQPLYSFLQYYYDYWQQHLIHIYVLPNSNLEYIIQWVHKYF